MNKFAKVFFLITISLYFVFLSLGCTYEKVNSDNGQYNYKIENKEEETTKNETKNSSDLVEEEKPKAKRVETIFAGDILLGDNVGKALNRYGMEEAFKYTGTHSNEADIFIVNLENPISERGKPESNKQFLFRSEPESVEVLKHIGVDVAVLANNHILDYGVDALIDTIEILKDNGIKSSGAGRNIREATKPVYIDKNGLTIGIVSSSHVIPFVSWYAGEDTPGVTGCYDPTLLIDSVNEAKSNADIVIAYIHWGEELKESPLEYQINLGRKLIDAGCNIVVGAHPHVLQGIEYYNEGIIAYSLGNYIFTNLNRETMLLKVVFEDKYIKKVQVIPYRIKNYFPREVTEKEKQLRFYRRIESLSWGIRIDDMGQVHKQKS